MVISGADNVPPLKLLSSREYRILSTVVRRIVPGSMSIPGLDLAQKIDGVLAGVRAELSRDFKLLLILFQYGSPLLGGPCKRFTHMRADEQDSYLAGWQRSHLAFKRMGFQVFKRVALAAFYGSEESWSYVGYRGPWLNRGYPHDYQGHGIQAPAHS